MKAMRDLGSFITGPVPLVLLAFSLTILLQSCITLPVIGINQEVLTSSPTEEVYPPPQWGPTADPTIGALMHEAEATQLYEPPTPTIPPLPTLLPTPVVTSIPLADFPVIPGLREGTFTIVSRQENMLWAVDSDGQNERLLLDIGTKLPLFLVSGQFNSSPNGKQLTLVLSNLAEPSQKGGPRRQFDIYLYDLVSGDLHLLIQDGVEPVWSPNGAQIAYLSVEDYGLWILDITTDTVNKVFSINSSESDYRINSPSWSPGGNAIAFIRSFSSIRSGELWIVDIDEMNKAVQLIPMDMSVSKFSWSPYGDKIAFLSSAGEYNTISSPLNLWVIDITTGTQQQLTYNISSTGGTPSWSPDGDWIAFEGTNLLEGDSYFYDLWLVSINGAQLHRLTNDPESDLYPVWLPDSNILLFQKSSMGLMSFNLFDGSVKQVIPLNEQKIIEFIVLAQ